MLEVKHLTKAYENIKVVDNISFSVKRGEILGILGPNGAGKTTTLEILTGLINSDSGEVTLDGLSLFDHLPQLKKQIGFVSEDIPLYEYLTGKEYLLFICKIREIPLADAEKIINDYAEKFDLKEKLNHFIYFYSKGMKQKLSLISALIFSPSLLIMDEPLTGVDPISSIIIKKHIIEYAKKGNIVILSSHILEMVEKLCDKIVLLNKGKVIQFDSLENIKNQVEHLENLFVTNNNNE
jgi:ABC-2 type transport system ATP-binding protein